MLKHIVKGIIQMPLEDCQAWDINHLIRKPVPEFDHYHGKEKFPNFQSELPMVQLCAIPRCSIIASQEEETAASLSISPSQEVAESNKITSWHPFSPNCYQGQQQKILICVQQQMIWKGMKSSGQYLLAQKIMLACPLEHKLHFPCDDCILLVHPFLQKDLGLPTFPLHFHPPSHQLLSLCFAQEKCVHGWLVKLVCLQWEVQHTKRSQPGQEAAVSPLH